MRLNSARRIRGRAAGAVTATSPYVRDAMSVGRMMMLSVLALVPAISMALYNTGHQARSVLTAHGLGQVAGWRGTLLDLFGVTPATDGFWPDVLHGAVYYLPVFAAVWLTGLFWQSVFSHFRRNAPAPGLAVTALTLSLILPPTVPVWQASLGMTLGLILGREIFGGTGRTFLNPALTGAIILIIAYPADMEGAAIWIAAEPHGGTTALNLAAKGGLGAISEAGITWFDAFIGTIPGAFGETSALACLIGLAVLLAAGTASWRVVTGIVVGSLAATLIFAELGGSPISRLPWSWHLVLGGFAFGAVFIATDPASSAITNPGRWIYGFLIGAFAVLIRVANPGHADGMLFALLLGSIFAPLIDYSVMWLNIRRREQRDAQ